MIDTSLVNVESLNDSIAKIIPIIQAIKENSAPAPFTYINIIISLFAAIFGLGSFYFAKKTADNVSRLSKDTQIMLCEDLIRDMLAQIVRLLAAWRRLGNNEWNITEDALEELSYWPSDIYFKQDVYNSKSRIYKKIYNLKLRMLDYNNGIDIYKKLIPQKRIGEKEIKKLYINNWKNLYKAYDIYHLINKKYRKKATANVITDLYKKLHSDYINILSTKDAYKDVRVDKDLKAEFMKIFEFDINETGTKDPLREIKETLKDLICSDASIFEQCLCISEKKEQDSK